MVDLVADVARLPGRITKNGKPREVPLSRVATRILKTLKQQQQGKTSSSKSARVAKTRKPGGDNVLALKPRSVTRAMERAIERARERYVEHCAQKGKDPDPGFLVDLHFHDLRHEATSRLAEVFNLHELMKITGESDAKMLMRYYHPKAEDFAKRMRAVSRKPRSAAKRSRKRRVSSGRAAGR